MGEARRVWDCLDLGVARAGAAGLVRHGPHGTAWRGTAGGDGRICVRLGPAGHGIAGVVRRNPDGRCKVRHGRPVVAANGAERHGAERHRRHGALGKARSGLARRGRLGAAWCCSIRRVLAGVAPHVQTTQGSTRLCIAGQAAIGSARPDLAWNGIAGGAWLRAVRHDPDRLGMALQAGM